MKDTFEEMQMFRCPKCNKLVFKYKLKGWLSVEIKCSRCNTNFSAILEETTGTIE